MPSLLNKLRMLEAETPRPARSLAAEKPGECHHVRQLFPHTLFCSFANADPELLQSLYGCAFSRETQKEDILFLDTETTGLSGGAGTVAFQVGAGYFTQSGFVVEQWLMHDYSQEAMLLAALNGLMKRFSVICTFNGRTFDVPLLKTRFLMNRIAGPRIPAIHADVLYPARRVWKLRLKSCTLGHLEEELLGVIREDDLPGALVPQAYFQYLKDGNFAPMERILAHNRQDIVSLAQLFFFLYQQAKHPEQMNHAEDLFSLARSLEKQGQRESAVKCYRLLSKGSLRAQGFAALARDARRQGQTDAAVKLYQAMLRRGEQPVESCEALAKLYEHQLKDPAQAISYTRQALLILSEPTLHSRDKAVQEKQIALQYRYARLRRKFLKAPQDK
ncbi:MAG: ribonuclease H-like domain-containing protein [Clostridiales bacterium]|nr:ribonuclease H-like domain-containing protein [Clostridiales bacterium]